MDWRDRFGSHSAAKKNAKPWWREIATIKLEWFPDVAAADAAERGAIARERPRYNRLHNGPVTGWQR